MLAFRVAQAGGRGGEHQRWAVEEDEVARRIEVQPRRAEVPVARGDQVGCRDPHRAPRAHQLRAVTQQPDGVGDVLDDVRQGYGVIDAGLACGALRRRLNRKVEPRAPAGRYPVLIEVDAGRAQPPGACFRDEQPVARTNVKHPAPGRKPSHRPLGEGCEAR